MRPFDMVWLIGHIQLLEIAEGRTLTPEEIRSAYHEAQYANFTVVDLRRPLTTEERAAYLLEHGDRIRAAIR